MSSDARVIASRENGRKGGPNTDQGRARSAANSTKFGFYSKKGPVLSPEDQTLYDAFLAGIIATHNPTTPHEKFIVEQIAATLWRIDRFETAQDYFVEHEMSAQANAIKANNPDGISGDTRISLAIHHIVSVDHSAFCELNRIVARFHRIHHRLLKQLQDLQGPRFGSNAPSAAPPAATPNPTETTEPSTAAPSAPNLENEPRSAVDATTPAFTMFSRLQPPAVPNAKYPRGLKFMTA